MEDVMFIPENFKIDRIEGDKIFLKRKECFPKTWEECVEMLKNCEYIDGSSNIHELIFEIDDVNFRDKNTLPLDYGEPVLALMQLLVCREVYRQGWKPDLTTSEPKYIITVINGKIDTSKNHTYSRILSFQSEEIRDKFLENFRDLIEEAKELI